jgi:hypothetical protein
MSTSSSCSSSCPRFSRAVLGDLALLALHGWVQSRGHAQPCGAGVRQTSESRLVAAEVPLRATAQLCTPALILLTSESENTNNRPRDWPPSWKSQCSCVSRDCALTAKSSTATRRALAARQAAMSPSRRGSLQKSDGAGVDRRDRASRMTDSSDIERRSSNCPSCRAMRGQPVRMTDEIPHRVSYACPACGHEWDVLMDHVPRLLRDRPPQS